MGGILVAPHDEVLDQLQPPVRDYSGCNGISVQGHFYSAVHKLTKKTTVTEKNIYAHLYSQNF